MISERRHVTFMIVFSIKLLVAFYIRHVLAKPVLFHSHVDRLANVKQML